MKNEKSAKAAACPTRSRVEPTDPPPDDGPAHGDGPDAPTVQRVLWSAATDCGRFRKDNEDAFLLFTCERGELILLGKDGSGDLESHDFVFAVSDGMGGANLGERASRMVVEELKNLIPQAYRAGVAGFKPDFHGVLGQALDATHQKINFEASCYPEGSGMGATLTMAWLTETELHFAHVGDSRLYYLHEGESRQLSHDHTRAGALLRKGLISERQARNHPQRNILHQALGPNISNLEPQLGTVRLHPGDRFLLCSDGLTDGLFDHRLGDLLADESTGRDILGQMIKESLFQSGRDNITAILLKIE